MKSFLQTSALVICATVGLSGCYDMTQTAGGLRFSSSGLYKTVVKNSAIGQVATGYAEVKINFANFNTTAAEAGILMRTSDVNDYYACGIRNNGTGGINAGIAGSQNNNGTMSQFNLPTQETVTTDSTTFTGIHTIGCEIKTVSGHDVMTMYLDGTQRGSSYTIGSDPVDIAPPATGLVAMEGYDPVTPVTVSGESVGVGFAALSFKFYSAKP